MSKEHEIADRIVTRLLFNGDISGLRELQDTLVGLCARSLGGISIASDLMPYTRTLPFSVLAKWGLSARKSGDINLAAHCFAAAIQQNTTDPDLYREFAATLRKGGRWSELDQLLQTAADSLPKSDLRNAILANLYRYGARPEAANELKSGLLERLRDQVIEDPKAFLELAQISVDEGAVTQAAYCLERASSLSHTQRFRTIRKNLAPVLTELELEIRGAAERYVADGFQERIYAPEILYERLVQTAPTEGRADAVGLLIVVNSLNIGGSERNAIITANELSNRRSFPWIKVLVIEDGGSALFRQLLDPKIELLSLNNSVATRPFSAGLARILAGMTPRNTSDTIAKLIAVFLEKNPLVVHAYAADVRCIQVGAAAICSGVRAFLNVGGFTPSGRGRGIDYEQNERWMRGALRALLRSPRLSMLHCSETAAKDYQNWLNVTPAKFAVNYFGVSDAEMTVCTEQVARIREKHALASDGEVLGGVFRLEEVKRPGLWVETAALVAAAHPHCKFVLVGSGRLQASLERSLKQLGLQSRFILAGEQVDVVSWYATMSVYMQTSASEGLGNSLIEAQALGIPVVVPRIGGMPEALLNGETGWIAETDSPGALAELVIWILRNPNWRAAAAKKAREFVRQRFSRERMMIELLGRYTAIS